MKACYTFLIGSADRSTSTRRFTHANIGFAIGVLRTIIVSLALDSNNRTDRTSTTGVQFASYEGTSSITLGTSTSWSVIDDFAKSVLTASSTE